MSDPTPSGLRLATTEAGHLCRIEGRGTAVVSEAFHEQAVECLAESDQQLVLDLSACEFLDSTFLGCLINLHKGYGRGSAQRFVVACPRERRDSLFGYTKLDKLITVVEDPPQTTGPFTPVPLKQGRSSGFGRHVAESHQQLAEIEGPQQAVFAEIAEKMQSELGKHE